jgi:hypothetical protein
VEARFMLPSKRTVIILLLDREFMVGVLSEWK